MPGRTLVLDPHDLRTSGAVLVEYHLVFEEPQGWFGGSNLLRSKLPLVCQDGVRKFRRRMATPLASDSNRSVSER